MNAIEKLELPETAAPLTPPIVLQRAIDSARERAGVLHDGLRVLLALGSGDRVRIDGPSLEWLAEQFMTAANDIMTDLDYAQYARDGNLYPDAAERFGQPEEQAAHG